MYIPTQQAPEEGHNGIIARIKNFIRQSERVINITHKPKPDEYKHIALSTALGMVVIGVIGFAISMAVYYLKG